MKDELDIEPIATFRASKWGVAGFWYEPTNFSLLEEGQRELSVYTAEQVYEERERYLNERLEQLYYNLEKSVGGWIEKYFEGYTYDVDAARKNVIYDLKETLEVATRSLKEKEND